MADQIKFDEEDLMNLTASVSKLAMSLFTGKIETTKISVEIEVPTAIADVIQNVAKKVGVTTEEMFGKMASDGLKFSLQEQMNLVQQKEKKESVDPQPETVTDPLKAMGIDTSGLMEKFGQFQELTDKLTEMSKVVENAAAGIEVNDAEPSKKDNS